MFQVKLPHAVDGPGAATLLQEIRAAVDAPEHEAIVFTGSGDGVFCNGLDVSAIAFADAGHEVVVGAVEAFTICLTLLRNSRKPTIALVDGVARGGGVGLASACDVVVATERSRFALPELLWGLLPAVIYPAIRQRLSLQQCRLWVLTGGTHTAVQAREAGLVDEVVAANTLDRAVRHWERQLLRPQPEAVAKFRAFLNEDVTETEHAARRGVTLTGQALLDDELRGALRRFYEDGLPPWERS